MTEPLTLTEEELQTKIDEAVKKAVADKTTELEKKHNEAMAQQRIKADDEKKKAVDKAVAEANLSAEQKAQKELEEQRKLDQEELAQLRLEKKVNDRASKLKEKGLPDFFKNDSRLLNAEDEQVDEVIKVISEEYKSVLPKGATVSTNVDISTKATKSEAEKELERMRNLGRTKSYVQKGN